MEDRNEMRETWRQRAPFSADQAEKDAFFQQEMKRLTEYHRRSCRAYDDICHGLGYDDAGLHAPGEGPYLPVALFKDLELVSVPPEDVVRQVTSSGTSGQQVSRIFLDAATAELQRWALASITGDFIGGRRLPMLIIDSPDVLRDRRKFSARGAGILGFSMMSSKRYYALDEQMRPDWDSIRDFQEAAKAGPSFAFGFTFMIWAYFYRALKEAGQKLDLNGCYLIHGGGWKKLQDQSVSDEAFREALRDQCGFGQISDYYGMAEQTGSIFMQCPEGHLHASLFSDIDVLDPVDLTPVGPGEWGLLALRSWIPASYPGHRLLTEDWGRILGIDDCPCGRKGKYFEISGRIKKAEIRGCSDTFAAGAGSGASGVPEHEDDRAYPVDDAPDLLAGSWPPEVERRQAFDPLVMGFLEKLSALFMKDPDFRQYPDIYALGFWLRDAHLKQLRTRQEAVWGADAASRTGIGPVLHITPSNMPAMFAYSWITSLLAGDSNVVRISEKGSEVTDTILRGIGSVLAEPVFKPLRRSNAFIRFPRDHRLLEDLSLKAAARMIWGGDATVARISAVPGREGSIDIAFPDKYSIALLDETAIGGLSADELRLQADLFCRDTYGADQNACSSPRSVFWIRSDQKAADPKGIETDLQDPFAEVRKRWWDAVDAEARRYDLQPWMVTEKYRMFCAACARDRRIGQLDAWRGANRLYVVPCGKTKDWISRDSGALPEARLGIFYEFALQDIGELQPLLQEKIQTVVCVGIDPAEFLRQVRAAGCPGVDRAVGPGQALDFDTIWDRKDLIGLLSR